MTPQELKNSILQLAIQGRLVEQRESEAPIDLSHLKKKATEELDYELPSNWTTAHLESVTDSIPSKQYQILESQVQKEGKYAVISQSKEFSIGFSNEEGRVFHHYEPVVIFGDHTTEIKLVGFDFIVGADGVKIFSPKSSQFLDVDSVAGRQAPPYPIQLAVRKTSFSFQRSMYQQTSSTPIFL